MPSSPIDHNLDHNLNRNLNLNRNRPRAPESRREVFHTVENFFPLCGKIAKHFSIVWKTSSFPTLNCSFLILNFS